MHADMHMNVYIGFLFIYFMNSLSMCELKCRVWRRIVTFLSVRDPLFLLTNKRIIKWSTYAESVLMDKHMGDFWILFVCFFILNSLTKLGECCYAIRTISQKCKSVGTETPCFNTMQSFANAL